MARRSKYGARRTKLGGNTYDSLAEARRGRDLAIFERQGIISELKRQVSIELVTHREGKQVPVKYGSGRTARYVVDFTYRDADGNLIFEDVKGYDTALSKLKRAIVEGMTGIHVHVVRMP